MACRVSCLVKETKTTTLMMRRARSGWSLVQIAGVLATASTRRATAVLMASLSAVSRADHQFAPGPCGPCGPGKANVTVTMLLALLRAAAGASAHPTTFTTSPLGKSAGCTSLAAPAPDSRRPVPPSLTAGLAPSTPLLSGTWPAAVGATSVRTSVVRARQYT